MTINAYEFYLPELRGPITVMAGYLEEATRLFEHWHDLADPEYQGPPPTVHAFGPKWLALRPWLQDLARREVSGICYWDPQVGFWTVGSPDDEGRLSVMPPETAARCFRFESDEGDDAIVFSPDADEATRFYLIWYIDRWGTPPKHFSSKQIEFRDLRGEFATLRDEMTAGLTGVAHRTNRTGWRILAPDWEPDGEFDT